MRECLSRRSKHSLPNVNFGVVGEAIGLTLLPIKKEPTTDKLVYFQSTSLFSIAENVTGYVNNYDSPIK